MLVTTCGVCNRVTSVLAKVVVEVVRFRRSTIDVMKTTRRAARQKVRTTLNVHKAMYVHVLVRYCIHPDCSYLLCVDS